jgi:hypothetical protein
MRFIPTKVHGVLDYSSGLLLILAPWLFGFATGGPAQIIPIVIGLMIITMSIFIDYEAGVVRTLSMPFHLTMDVIAGFFLAVSPWLFGFAELIFWPHLIFGLLEMGAGLLTQRVPASNTVRNIE